MAESSDDISKLKLLTQALKLKYIELDRRVTSLETNPTPTQRRILQVGDDVLIVEIDSNDAANLKGKVTEIADDTIVVAKIFVFDRETLRLTHLRDKHGVNHRAFEAFSLRLVLGEFYP